MISPGQLVAQEPASQPFEGLSTSLSDIANGILRGVGSAVEQKLVSNITRSSNTEPLPDLSSAAANPKASTFLNGESFGVSMPLLLLGGGALVYLLAKRL